MTIPLPFEPFRAKTVEPIHVSTPQQRRRWLVDAEHNLFRLSSQQVMIDLLTDSGTGAMSSAQWAAMMQGDESYAGSASFFRLNEIIRLTTGLSHMLPTHQGRIAERLLVEAIIGQTPAGCGLIVPNNAHFDTTRRMIEASGAEAVNLLIDDLRLVSDDSAVRAGSIIDRQFPGNMDVCKLEQLLHDRADDVPFVLMTVTCNSNGGQPASMENLQQVRDTCDRFGKMLFLDACRFAENAWFIKQHERGMSEVSVSAIVRQMFDLADGAVMSTRKDGLCNVGGLLLLRDDVVYKNACKLCVLTEGFLMTYGSLPGRDLEAIGVGLQEVMNENYLNARIGMVQRLGAELVRGGVAIVQPVGGHAVYLDAQHFCPHLSRAENPAQALACAIYEHGGIRSTRIGTVLKNSLGESMEVVRLAVPRRLYSTSHLDYVADAIVDLRSRAQTISGVKNAMPPLARCEEPAFQAA